MDRNPHRAREDRAPLFPGVRRVVDAARDILTQGLRSVSRKVAISRSEPRVGSSALTNSDDFLQKREESTVTTARISDLLAIKLSGFGGSR